VTFALVDDTETGAFAASFFGFFTSLRLFMPFAIAHPPADLGGRARS
jgi:hypothetical protein